MDNLGELKINLVHELINIYIENQDGLIRLSSTLMDNDEVTLNQIYQEFKDHNKMIYVFCDGGLQGRIYRCGNYGDGIWQEYGITQGYA